MKKFNDILLFVYMFVLLYILRHIPNGFSENKEMRMRNGLTHLKEENGI